MTKQPKRPRDAAQLAKFIVDVATGEVVVPPSRKTPDAAAHHGKIGGQTRAESLSPEKRSEIARKAALKRWER